MGRNGITDVALKNHHFDQKTVMNQSSL